MNGLIKELFKVDEWRGTVKQIDREHTRKDKVKNQTKYLKNYPQRMRL